MSIWIYFVVSCDLFSFLVGHALLAINGIPVTGTQLDDGRDAFEVLSNAENYPLNIKFGRPKLNTNEKIFLASMFHSYEHCISYVIAVIICHVQIINSFIKTVLAYLQFLHNSHQSLGHRGLRY